MKTRYARKIRKGVKQGLYHAWLAEPFRIDTRKNIYASGYTSVWGLSKRAYERTWIHREHLFQSAGVSKNWSYTYAKSRVK